MSRTARLIDFKKDGSGKQIVRLHENVLEAVFKNERHLSVLLLSITGAFRSGKSFLMNLVAMYLEHIEKVSFCKTCVVSQKKIRSFRKIGLFCLEGIRTWEIAKRLSLVGIQ